MAHGSAATAPMHVGARGPRVGVQPRLAASGFGPSHCPAAGASARSRASACTSASSSACAAADGRPSEKSDDARYTPVGAASAPNQASTSRRCQSTPR
ncbi:MAG: hypothetical protein DCC71_19405 [Proteobacteria bacterium]|nr:MAG: hypothetical protein DCC71_19405 [Pseudomonadota bacterium]